MKSRITILLGLLALQSFAVANEGPTLPVGASDLAPDPRFEQYKPGTQVSEPVTQWKIDLKEIDLVYEEQNPSAVSEISFKIIKDEVHEQDEIQIIAVHLLNSEKLEIGSTIEVIGTYKLGSVNDAQLGLSITSEGKGAKHRPAPLESMQITTGKGTFHLVREVDRYGGIHLSIYPKEQSGRYGQSTSRLYFLELHK